MEIFEPRPEARSGRLADAAPLLVGRERETEVVSYFLKSSCRVDLDPGASKLLVMQGGTGLGKSGLLLNVRKWVELQEIDLELYPHPLLLGSPMSEIPFRLCHAILERLLGMHGEDHASHFCRLEVSNAYFQPH
eukprot:scaffold416628_cov44-Prasinocladus_malaysianus.AAC.1